MSALYDRYKSEIVAELTEKHGYENHMEVPRLEKVVISTGISSDQDRSVFDEAQKTLAAISGQKPVVTKARKSIANFKIRAGVDVGCMVTLRGMRMYDFVYRLVNIALPRVRDFRGVSPKSFDGHGNYTMGIDDQTIFTEIVLDDMKHSIGMNITIVTSAETNEEGYDLLRAMGMPFAAN